MKRFGIREISEMAALCAVALALGAVEAFVPAPAPVPGAKLGLANAVTVYAMFSLGPAQALMILAGRLFLAAAVLGRAMAFLYSAAGGLLCFLAMLAARKAMPWAPMWLCSALGAVCHNIGQLAVAVAVTRTLAVAAYLPALAAFGIVAGTLTGSIAQLVDRRLAKRSARP